VEEDTSRSIKEAPMTHTKTIKTAIALILAFALCGPAFAADINIEEFVRHEVA
jgi:hypothetical protein